MIDKIINKIRELALLVLSFIKSVDWTWQKIIIILFILIVLFIIIIKLVCKFEDNKLIRSNYNY